MYKIQFVLVLSQPPKRKKIQGFKKLILYKRKEYSNIVLHILKIITYLVEAIEDNIIL